MGVRRYLATLVGEPDRSLAAGHLTAREVNYISAIVRLCRFSLSIHETETLRAKAEFTTGDGRVSRLNSKSLIERGLSVSTMMRQSRER